MINIILTLDYEIFGNGAGDIIRNVVEPTDRILNICDRYGAKMTIMFKRLGTGRFRNTMSKCYG